MNRNIDAAQLRHRRIDDGSAALGCREIGGDKQVVLRQRRLGSRRREHFRAGFPQSRHHGFSDSLRAARHECPQSGKLEVVAHHRISKYLIRLSAEKPKR